MVVSQSDLAEIVAQASSLSERLSNQLFEVDTAQVNESQVSNDRLAHWCQVVAQGNSEKFHKRLQWDGLDIDSVRPVIGNASLPDAQSLPTWAETLGQIIQTSTDSTIDKFAQETSKIPIYPDKPLPFENVLLPALLVGRQKLLDCLGVPSLSPEYLPLKLLSEEAYRTLERSLLKRLVNLSAKTLQFEFSIFRPNGYNLLNLLLEKFNLLGRDTSDNCSKEHYSAFVQKLLRDGLLAFFQKYPVLGKLMATTIDFWVEATAEFLQRLQADQPEIERMKHLTLCDHPNQSEKTEICSGKVTAISGSLSDFHNRGRSVLILTFKSGQKLVYKPKNLGLEVVYNQFLDWCNQHGAPLPFKVLKLYERETYGWVFDCVEQLPCADEAAAQRFYQRTGMLLCLLYVLGGNDCHYENLIASGEHLVLVDAETLMHPQTNPIEGSVQAIEEITEVNQQFWDSVLRTGLLPRWYFSGDNRIAYDISGIGSVASQQAPWRAPRWKAVNTDDMHLAYETVKLAVQANVPMLNEVPLSPNDYLEELVEGFKRMYHFLIEQRQALLTADTLLASLQAQQVRFIFRPTKVYEVLLENTLAPKFLRNGVDRSIELDILSQTFLTAQNKPSAWSILQAELKAMEQLDIPYLGTFCSSKALTVGVEQPIEHYFKQPSYNQFLTRLQKLNEADLAMQLAIIRGTFQARMTPSPVAEQLWVPYSSSFKTVDCSQITPLTSSQLLQKAQAIAGEIQERAFSDASGHINWIGLNYVPNAERFQFQPLGHSLYDGSCGIALFLAALDRVTGHTQFQNLALDALKPLRRILQTSNHLFAEKFTRRIGMGGATGIGSIIYSLVKISQFLQDTTLLEDACLAANLLTPELIAADRQFDVMGGAAGAILGLLTLYTQTGKPAVLDKAINCGQHLLEHRVSVDDKPKAWKTLGEKPLTGFSHGAAGIAYALFQLYAVTQDHTYLKAAQEGIAYERSVFSTAAANWPDFRAIDEDPNRQTGFMVTWCHGAPGIGLARLGCLSIYQTDEILQDVEVALTTTQKYGLWGVDHLCCGNFGRLELLLVASQKLSRPQLLETTQKQAAWVVTQAEKTGAYRLFGNLSNQVFSPSFFQGTAGIGYELLRLAYPEVLPAVLLWD
jgi:type 2 lantibiotic biosynthesis protein LanM